MSLADIYRETFGGEQEKTGSEAQTPPEEGGEEVMTKEAADAALAEAMGSLTDEEREKLAQVVEVLDEENLEFEHDLQKLACAADIVDAYDEEMEVVKQAEEIEAGGRIMARAFVDELSKMED